ncbi:MAG: hypothetical protein JW950_14100 [Deltaproteobacteria bacterium]|nr:hypothetical protein [Deltaproteobacteria bacterium]
MEGTKAQLANLVFMEDADDVYNEIKNIALLMEPEIDFHLCMQVYDDIVRLFEGGYPGYKGFNTAYHDLAHTMHVTLAMVRLMHGAFLQGERFSSEEINIGITSGLMHDTGYIQREEDLEGTGAKYTLTHIARSIDFVAEYFRDNPVYSSKMPCYRDILNCTGLNTKVSEIAFASPSIELLGKMLGTADLLGQMSDRYYLEKLPGLYDEFVEAGITDFFDPLDLLDKTFGFYDMTKKRFSRELGRVYEYALAHFRARWGIEDNLYLVAIERNIGYLEAILTHHREDYDQYLRRSVPNKKATGNLNSRFSRKAGRV